MEQILMMPLCAPNCCGGAPLKTALAQLMQNLVLTRNPAIHVTCKLLYFSQLDLTHEALPFSCCSQTWVAQPSTVH